jgi:ABC-type cobalamin/Fe3+-siderophores transport system ATPase subunit
MDESKLLLGKLLNQIQSLQLQGSLSEQEFRILLLYAIADQMIDWSSARWAALRSEHDSRNEQTLDDGVWILMEKCGGLENLPEGKSYSLEKLVELLDDMHEKVDGNDWGTLFDTLFYSIIGESGFDRSRAEIGAALASGLANHRDLIDLDPYCAEALFEHCKRYNGRFRHRVTKNKFALFDLVLLRLHVWKIDFELVDNQSTCVDEESLAILDHVADRSSPFGNLLGRLRAAPCKGRLLMLFTSKPRSDRKALEALRQTLLDDDLLEAVFDFNSFNAKAKPVRCYAWLLNGNKHHVRQTLCIDTRNLLGTAHDVTAQQLATFSAAICATWASAVPSLEHSLGSLNGLFNQWFDAGYQDIDGVCKVLPSAQVINASVTTRRVPQAKGNREPSLLDRRPLIPLLGEAAQSPGCVYIIGDNGVGKSLLLASLVPYLQQQVIPCSAIVMGPSDRFPLSDRKRFPSYRYLGDKTGKGYSPQAVERKLIQLMLELVLIDGRANLLDSVLDQVELKHSIYLAPKGIFSSLQLQPEELARRVIPIDQAARERLPLKDMCLALSHKGKSRLMPFADLSSGEQQVLHLFTKIIVTAKPSKVLLVDEPEISLHVRWQQILPALFSHMARELRCLFVIATHSPTLVANARNPLNHCFLAKDQRLHAIPAQHRHSVETILLEGFETYTPHNREVAERCAALVGEAIRATNRADLDHATVQRSLEKALVKMRETMHDFSDKEDQRYQQDVYLIEQAGTAIAETFTLSSMAFPA